MILHLSNFYSFFSVRNS